jgi:general secretion pathway protein K
VRQGGGGEDDVYQRMDPPYRAANRPLLSLDELRLVEGFDGALVEALRPYVTVYPLAGSGGVNPNTAPSWVLAQLTRGSDVSGMRPVEEEDVRRILDARDEGVVCSAAGAAADCTPAQELFDGETVSPPMLDRSNVFVVRAIARVVDVERRIEAVIDRSDPNAPLRLSWRVQ